MVQAPVGYTWILQLCHIAAFWLMFIDEKGKHFAQLEDPGILPGNYVIYTYYPCKSKDPVEPAFLPSYWFCMTISSKMMSLTCSVFWLQCLNLVP